MRIKDVKVGMRVIFTDTSGCYKRDEIGQVNRIPPALNSALIYGSDGKLFCAPLNDFEPYRPKFNVGDRVRIRSWESMEREFGLDSDGDIKTQIPFTIIMKHLCGREATIREVKSDGRVRLDDTISKSFDYAFDMLEKIEEKKEIETMDKMTEVAKLLGVVKGEKFDIEGSHLNPHMITNDGLTDINRDTYPWKLGELIVGRSKIIKLPFKPAKRGEYWIIDKDGDACLCNNNQHAYDCAAFFSGNCFRTRAEAEAALPEIMRKMQEFLNA